MPQVTLTSKVYPGFDFGGYQVEPAYLAAGAAYEIDEANAQKLKDAMGHLSRFNPNIAKNIKLQFSGLESAVAVAVAKPAAPVPRVSEATLEAAAPPVETISGEDLVDAPIELTEEDRELIEIELDKLKGKTISDAEPILIATAGNPELPKELRKAYLETAIAAPDIKKGLKDVAEKLLEQI